MKEEDCYRQPHGYKCPRCGNEISYEESEMGEAILCTRCPDEEYTIMEPFFTDFDDEF